MVIEKNLIDVINQVRDEIVSLFEDKEDDEQLYIEIGDIIDNYDIDEEKSMQVIKILQRCLERKGYIVEVESDVLYII